MPRPIWTGSISFGLMSIPVKPYPATSSHRIRFHQLQRGTGERIRRLRVAESTEEEVPYDDIVKGYEVAPERYVVVEDEELDAVAPGRSRSIEIEDLVELQDVDPIKDDLQTGTGGGVYHGTVVTRRPGRPIPARPAE